jgi:hypothetical protein
MIAHILLFGAAAMLPADSAADKSVHAFRVTAAQGAPVLDGRLDDVLWAHADSVHGFIQVEPRQGEPSQYSTVARIAFDNQNIYVGIRAYDPEPNRIAAQLTRRDQDSSSDWLYVGFDAHRDLRTAYVFGVNPLGVKKDFIKVDGQRDDSSWDAVWEVATRRDSLGWTAEFRIPFSALRYSTEKDVWGFQVGRMVERDREFSMWTNVRPDDHRQVARFGELHGMRGIPAPRRLEVMPYSVSSLTRAPGDVANPFYSTTKPWGSAGVDVKYGVSSDLTLDLTINPDFGQVEADPSQVNLSAFETFLPERRPFFTEGADIFRFNLALGDGDDANEQLFYSRRIGRAPQLRADNRGGFVDAPQQTAILGAAKLSGRAPGGWSVGAMNAVTRRETARIAGNGWKPGDRFDVDVVEPLANYSVLRAQRNANQGRTQVGVVGTGVLRDLNDDQDVLRSSAFAGGMDFSHRWNRDQWLASGFLVGSRIDGSPESILRVQSSSARYFQRPDADHLHLDSAATSLSGWSSNYTFGKVSGRWVGAVLGQVRSPGFEVNDVGYQRDADIANHALWLGHRHYEPGRLFRHYGVNFNLWNGNDFGLNRLNTGTNVNGWGQLLSYWSVNAGINRGFDGLSRTAMRGGPAIRTPGNWNSWAGVGTDSRKALAGSFNMSGSLRDEDTGWSYHLSSSARWRPSAGTSVSVAPFFSANRNAWQYVAQPKDAAANPQYVFAELDQRTVGASLRLNQTFSPTLSLQVYAQPFVSTGGYDDFKLAADPRARRFEERFRNVDASAVDRGESTFTMDLTGDGRPDVSFDNPEFSYRDLNLNAVLRWEYRLGSTIFFVWSHGRTSFEQDGSFRPRRDFQDLFTEPSRNVFMIKANYWMNI